MADVFLSYSSQDRQRIKPLAEALEARGLSVWWDRALGAGEDYSSVITRELAAAKAVVVVWTESSAASTFVRDEAGRARDDARLIPVLLDQVEIPLGFGAFQAEDFTRWNGQPQAAQVSLLEEAIRAKLEGRSIDGGAVAAKRRRLMTRIRVVSVLTVVGGIVGIAAGLNNIFDPFGRNDPPPITQPDHGSQLLDLLNQGKLTPEQAIELARLLESGALGEQQSAALEAPDAAAPAPSVGQAPAAEDTLSTRSTRGIGPGGDVAVVAVSQAEFDEDARITYRDAVAELLRNPDPEIRQATLQLSDATTRDAAMQTLWAKARDGGTAAAAIYRVCGAVGEANNHPLGEPALARARAINPEDSRVWRMSSYALRRDNRPQEAEGAALVGAGLEAQSSGQTAVAEQRLQEALPRLQAPESRAFVEGALGDAAARRNDWSAATRRYGSALELREQAPANTPAAQSLQVDAQKLVRALDRSGRTADACRQAQEVQAEHDVAPADQELAQRCSELRIQVRPSTIQRSPTIQRAPVQRAPATQE